jgi:hypothetical protein
MQGRYGNDALNRGLLSLIVGLLIINIFLDSYILSCIMFVIWAVMIYRMFSKNIYKRYNENQKYLSYMKPLERYKNLLEKQKDDPNHKYFRCPECKQMVRVPRGRGKITITCPKCQRQFDRKS